MLRHLLSRCLGCVQQMLQQVHEELRPIGTAAVEADTASGEAAGQAAGQAALCWPLALDVLAASRNSAACRTVTRCRVGGRLALGGKQLFDSAKMRELQALLPRLKAEGHRVLLFSQYTQMLDLLEALMGAEHGGLGLSYLRLDGSTSQGERQQLIDEFQAEGSEVFAFLLSTRAGGQGINLTGADTVILHDLDWNPQLDRQAEEKLAALV